MFDFASIPVPSFLERDAAAVTAQLVADYEAAAGRTLQAGQVERLLINLFALREVMLRNLVQAAMEQAFLPWAGGPALDALGALVGEIRFGASSAATVLRFTLKAPLPTDYVVAAGSQVGSKDGLATFATDLDLLIPRGQVSGEVPATSQQPGPGANGYQPGDVKILVANLPEVGEVTNLTETSGGADPQGDEDFRQQVFQASEKFSTAGPAGAYAHHAALADRSIVAVAVTSPGGGIVNVYPLLSSGLPGPQTLDAVQAALSAETVRPLTDEVHVLAPEEVPYDLVVVATPLPGADLVKLRADLAARAQAHLYGEALPGGGRSPGRQLQLGLDLVPSQFVQGLAVGGLYELAVTSPARAVLAPHQWANCRSVTVTVQGAPDAA